jgi:DNA-binding beta-propeller fold protein YncE
MKTQRTIGLLLPALLIACGDDPVVPSQTFVTGSSTLAFNDTESALWITSPDDDEVLELDAETLQVLQRIPVAGAPEQLAVVHNDIVVTTRLGNAVVIIDAETGSTELIPVPCGGTHSIAVGNAGGLHRAFISCPNDDLVISIEVETRLVGEGIHVPGRPTALAIAGGLVVVSSSLGLIRSVNPSDMTAVATAELTTNPDRAVTQFDALTATAPGGRVFGAYQLVDNNSRDRPPEEGGYGSVIDGEPRIEPRVLADCGSRYAVFDGGARVFSGPSAVAYSDTTGVLWVVHRYTQNVAAIRCSRAVSDNENGELEVLAQFRVGAGPRGIAVSRDGGTAYIDVGFDHAVSRLVLDAGTLAGNGSPVQEATQTVRRATGPLRFSEAGLRGRGLFFDATNTHLTPSGIVTCGTCHPNGNEDGITWFLHTETVGPKLRRTPPAWGARPAASPFHWDGEFTDGAVLATDGIQSLLGGDGLVIDTTDIATYMQEIPLPPPAPVESMEADTIEEGEAVFLSAGCAGCHSGELYTDQALHSVVADSIDPDGFLTDVATPMLIGVRARAPYLHDGRAESLEALFGEHNPDDSHGVTSTLSDPDLEALRLYLETR